MTGATFPLGEHVTDEWYPGATLPLPRHPQMEEGFELFTPDDERRFWLLEGHWSRGFTPLCVSTAYDVLWGTQYGANMYQLPPTKGQAARMSGVHGYVSDLPCHSPWEMMHRAGRVEKLVGPAIMSFPTLWAERLADIKAALAHFESADLTSMNLAELGVYLSEAWAFHRWAWEVHFELMDPLIGNYFAFRATCVELGIDEGDVTKFFQGTDTRVLETDRALWALATTARGTAVEKALRDADPGTALRASIDPTVVEWRARFHEFLQEYGWRTEGMCDPTLAPWVEDPTPPLTMLSTFLRKEADHDFEAAQRAAIEERDATLARVRASLDGDGLTRFEAGLGACYHANFAWWQEEHNVYIDMRAHIPLRMAALRIGEIVGVDQRDDLIYLFRHELDDLVAGDTSYADVRDLIAARRRYYEHGAAKRAEMPRVLGTPSTETDDPVMKEIFGVDQRLLDAVGNADPNATQLSGVPASSGVVQGRARVITSSDSLGDVEPDEILVCVFTTPNWTPAFSQIAGCVCDTGGALSHTAIVAREYRIPAVCGTGLATTLIRTGDLLEVDGTSGIVRILERAG